MTGLPRRLGPFASATWTAVAFAVAFAIAIAIAIEMLLARLKRYFA